MKRALCLVMLAACSAGLHATTLPPALARTIASDDARAVGRDAPEAYAVFARAVERVRTAAANERADRVDEADLAFAWAREEARGARARTRIERAGRARAERDESARREAARVRIAEAEATRRRTDEAARARLANVLASLAPRPGPARVEATHTLLDATAVLLATSELLDRPASAREPIARMAEGARAMSNTRDTEAGYTSARRAYDLASALAEGALASASSGPATAPVTTDATVAVLRGVFVRNGDELTPGSEARIASVAGRLRHATQVVTVTLDGTMLPSALMSARLARVRSVLVAHGIVADRVRVVPPAPMGREAGETVRIGVSETH